MDKNKKIKLNGHSILYYNLYNRILINVAIF